MKLLVSALCLLVVLHFASSKKPCSGKYPCICPSNVPIYQCLIDPCDVVTCPGYPNAVCRSNFCGGCNYNFYLGKGNRDVTDLCGCPPGVPQVKCFADPCEGKTCPNFPDAQCVANYCGGCNYEFYLGQKDVTKRC
ncbi:uncharacterized protein LOC141914868 [Tubulanus polymorphus]|uniref:uncharacterized protein LOC141914868 n=1 Tax=Tubulanus polymorphus TaxID=672921 RepID=UPI003DA21CEA